MKTMYVYERMSLESSQNYKCLKQKLQIKSKQTFYVQLSPPPPLKNYRSRDIVEKYGRAGEATNGNTAHALCMLDN